MRQIFFAVFPFCQQKIADPGRESSGLIFPLLSVIVRAQSEEAIFTWELSASGPDAHSSPLFRPVHSGFFTSTDRKPLTGGDAGNRFNREEVAMTKTTLDQGYYQVSKKHLLFRLLKNVQMQGTRNRGPTRRVGSPIENLCY